MPEPATEDLAALLERAVDQRGFASYDGAEAPEHTRLRRAILELVEAALEAGARSSYRVDKADEMDEAWFAGARTVGVTSGASVPEILVRDVITRLGQLGYGDVEEVRTATEDITFSLPKNLRADLKAAGDLPEAQRRGGRRSLPVEVR